MKKIEFFLYNRFSKGGRGVAKMLGVKPIARDRIVLHQNIITADALINWGCSPVKGTKTLTGDDKRFLNVGRIINAPEAVGICSNKATFFKTMSKTGGPRVPEFTTDLEQAKTWAAEGLAVLGRSNHGSSGKDIAFFAEDPERFVSSDFWLKYKKKKAEFRLHFIGDTWVIEQQKVLPKLGPDGIPIPKESVDFRIRTHRTGFIFQKNDIKVPDDVYRQAEIARSVIREKGLDFGAIDVIYNQSENQAYVLEINTAPGLEESSIPSYAESLRNYIEA